MSRQSLERNTEQDKYLDAANKLRAQYEAADLQLSRHTKEFASYKYEDDIATEGDDVSPKDPAIVAADVAAQITFLRKLKFQYLEQNAKDKYVKSIVSDIDDAPIVTAEDNKELAAVNEEKKAKLKVAKEGLAEVQHNIRTLAPMVEQDYTKVKQVTERATMLAQKILDARLALMRLRQTNPHPRLTIPMADQKLIDQVEEMQTLSDEVELSKKKTKAVKERVKTGALEIEKLRIQQAESERAVQALQLEEDDNRLVPLYDWYTASLSLHQSLLGLEESHSVSENELQLVYTIGDSTPPIRVSISLIFVPDTRELGGVETTGFDTLGVETTELIEAHIQSNDVPGLVALLLSRARAAANSV
ncbi:hypothetical protein EST38_g10876 [Candolleomyces aberdarensis]|uniref:Kinetochore protein Sos7 coiled-coil domain-containing protein n=1 Tax=Candolleomyces aberdarensis TaxID=2316362 RepID=A0A4Q2D8P5_9AGAR|nr:hypothetical protein EST38_g10876 [Candolleomyces aberdarensis]